RGSVLQPLFKMSCSCSKDGHPRPGQPYKGGQFCALLPDNKEGQKTAALLKKAFERGLTFQIKSFNGEERVTWGLIPHKTSWSGGKARNAYPDAQYLREVRTVL
ncbi:DTX3L ligase, partial [Pitta sordida]|nr:DTX3L ligase [Pitta sordida]